MAELPIFSDEVEKIIPSPDMLKKIAIAATTSASRQNMLRVVRKGFADRYLWLERTGDTDEVFGLRSGKFKPEPAALPLDEFTQVESFVGMTGEYNFRMRDIKYMRDQSLGTPWIGQLQTFIFDWSEEGVRRSELEIKSVPSMTSDEARRLREFYEGAETDIVAQETLVVTDRMRLPLYETHCARLLASFRQSARQDTAA